MQQLPSLWLLINIKVLKRKTDLAKEIISSHKVSVENLQNNFCPIPLLWYSSKEGYINKISTIVVFSLQFTLLTPLRLLALLFHRGLELLLAQPNSHKGIIGSCSNT